MVVIRNLPFPSEMVTNFQGFEVQLLAKKALFFRGCTKKMGVEFPQSRRGHFGGISRPKMTPDASDLDLSDQFWPLVGCVFGGKFYYYPLTVKNEDYKPAIHI